MPPLAGYAALASFAVGSLYVPQALLPVIAADVEVDVATAGLLITTLQIGYAAGLFLVVPLADDRSLARRSTCQLVLLGVAFAVAATASTPAVLFCAFGVLGLVASVGQSLIILAHADAAPGRSAHVVAVINAAMLGGMFGGRIVSGLLAGSVGWRATLMAVAVTATLAIPLLRFTVRRRVAAPREPRPYGSTLLATASALRDGPLLRLALVQFFVFASFTSMWTVITIHLTDGLGWSIAEGNLFGVVGLAGGAAAPLVLRACRVDPAGLGFAALLAGAGLAAVSHGSAPVLAAAMFATTVGNQSVHATNQDRAMTLQPGRRATANAVFMTVVFLGGASGAGVGPLAYAHGGMALTGAVALLSALIAAAWWLAWRRGRATR